MVQVGALRYEPDYAVPPGETLKETLMTLGLTQAELAKRTGLSRKHINQIAQGVAAITPETSLLLERATQVPAHIWNKLETNYREQLLRLEERERAKTGASWVHRFPVKELMRRGAMTPTQDAGQLSRQLCGFFGVANWETLRAAWLEPQASFRVSQAFEVDKGALAAWLRLGEVQAQGAECQAFDRESFRGALDEARALTVQPADVFVPRLRELCASAGVVVVFEPEIRGARVSGAARWLSPKRALIQLSLRFRSDDQVWFSFFHEAGHLLLHGKKQTFVHDGYRDGDEESEANRFAERILIPRRHEERFRSLRRLGEIKAFAEELGIAPGIVVGRLQREGLLSYGVGNRLKRRFQFVDG